MGDRKVAVIDSTHAFGLGVAAQQAAMRMAMAGMFEPSRREMVIDGRLGRMMGAIVDHAIEVSKRPKPKRPWAPLVIDEMSRQQRRRAMRTARPLPFLREGR